MSSIPDPSEHVAVPGEETATRSDDPYLVLNEEVVPLAHGGVDTPHSESRNPLDLGITLTGVGTTCMTFMEDIVAGGKWGV
jgi:hypothetical protein